MRRIIVLAAVALAGLAALPAGAHAAPPSPSPICVFINGGIFCTTDIKPLVDQIVADPVGYVCGNPAIYCGFTREG